MGAASHSFTFVLFVKFLLLAAFLALAVCSASSLQILSPGGTQASAAAVTATASTHHENNKQRLLMSVSRKILGVVQIDGTKHHEKLAGSAAAAEQHKTRPSNGVGDEILSHIDYSQTNPHPPHGH